MNKNFAEWKDYKLKIFTINLYLYYPFAVILLFSFFKTTECNIYSFHNQFNRVYISGYLRILNKNINRSQVRSHSQGFVHKVNTVLNLFLNNKFAQLHFKLCLSTKITPHYYSMQRWQLEFLLLDKLQTFIKGLKKQILPFTTRNTCNNITLGLRL